MGKWSWEELTPWMLIMFLIYQVWIPYGIWYLVALLIWDPNSTWVIWTIFMVIWVRLLWPLTIEWFDNISRKIKRRKKK